MRSDLSPGAVARRLADLRRSYEPETLESARPRLEAKRPAETFDEAAARRLEELRALCELTERLHARRR